MTIGVVDGGIWIGAGKFHAILLTVRVVIGAAVGGELGRLVDKRSGLGICTGVGGFPEAIAEVDGPKNIGI